eukprot:symbB.v1.2.029623.t1/scaffold3268.1/size60008/1
MGFNHWNSGVERPCLDTGFEVGDRSRCVGDKHSAFADGWVRDDRGPPTQKKYQISIQKMDANEQLGMDVKHRLGRLVVLAIHRGGAVDRANDSAKDHDLPEVKVNDIIVDVNGATLDTGMVEACKSAVVLHFTFTRREYNW